MTNHRGPLLEIRKFHEALGGQVLLDEPFTLIAERHVAGDRQVTAFVSAETTVHADILGAIERAHSIKRPISGGRHSDNNSLSTG